MQITSHPSPNFNDRTGGAKPSMLILHYTGMKTGRAALERLCDPESKVSAHYFIDEHGACLQLVEDDKRAWHAGASYWAEETDINSHSIGIELVNPGHECGYQPFSEQQLAPLIALCKLKIEEWGISPAGVLAHSDVAPARKTDPGELFPWERLAEQGIGLWPAPQEMDVEAAADLMQDQNVLRELFVNFGYDPFVSPSETLAAFHRHFYPEKFKTGENPAEADILSAAKLLSLLRLVHES